MNNDPKRMEALFERLCGDGLVPEVGQNEAGETIFIFDLCIPTHPDDPTPVDRIEPPLPKPPAHRRLTNT